MKHVIFSKDKKNYNNYIYKILKYLDKASFYININKCNFSIN
jgi:hypothetical protein